jgi:methyl-accepting chemotaxis protein
MGEVVAHVRRVTDLIGEISAASQQQSSGITQVNEAVSQLDRVTQQNAALVEQSAAAASSLKEQAAHLAEAVASFRVSRNEARRAIAAAQESSRAAGLVQAGRTDDWKEF